MPCGLRPWPARQGPAGPGPARRAGAVSGRAHQAPHRLGAVLRLYDTRTRQVEPVEPARRGALLMYSCGPTVYRDAHVGNLRSYLLADLIRRTAGRDGCA